MTATFHHYGVPTSTRQANENYLDGAGVFYTDPEASPYRIEFVRFEEGSPLPEDLKTKCHVAYVVESLEAAMAGKKVVLPPFEVSPTLHCAFIYDGDALVELMQISPSCGCCGCE